MKENYNLTSLQRPIFPLRSLVNHNLAKGFLFFDFQSFLFLEKQSFVGQMLLDWVLIHDGMLDCKTLNGTEMYAISYAVTVVAAYLDHFGFCVLFW